MSPLRRILPSNRNSSRLFGPRQDKWLLSSLCILGAADVAAPPGLGSYAQLGAVGILGLVTVKLLKHLETQTKRIDQWEAQRCKSDQKLAEALTQLRIHCGRQEPEDP